MLLGIDVGGTHTDAVVIDDTGIAAAFKVRTNHEDLLSSVTEVLEKVRAGVDAPLIERVNLSTTLTTNSIVEGKTEDVGVLVSGGPGIDPANYMICKDFHTLSGSTDHRGTIVRPLDDGELEQAVKACEDNGIRAFAAVGKFSPRNPSMEEKIRDVIGSRADVVTMGHQITGRLNFPRRIATAYFNSAVWRKFNQFAFAVSCSLKDFGITAKVNILKADGGTMPLDLARRIPVESILSGPAASVMGIISTCDIALDSIILDIGGTTTDIAVFASGAPLMEPDGISIGSYPTLVRSLLTRSIGIGGDSALSVLSEEVYAGPQRHGPSIADGGTHPTLIDAFNYLGRADCGDVEKSREGIEKFASERSIPAKYLAEKAVAFAVGKIEAETRKMIREINERPVYTLHEILEGKRIVPQKIYIMGGPAEVFKEPIFKAFGLSVTVPRHSGVTNAVGAALTRTTFDVELFADTDKRKLFIPSLGFKKIIEGDYSLKDAERDAKRHLLNFLRHEGIPSREENLEITHASAFNMVEGSYTVGKNIRVKCQIRPGILHRYKKLLGRIC